VKQVEDLTGGSPGARRQGRQKRAVATRTARRRRRSRCRTCQHHEDLESRTGRNTGAVNRPTSGW
jgi:hypothetical protein